MLRLALVGEEIGKARKKRRMTTFEVSQKTRIPERYVQCIESGDFASLPRKPFVFGFTRTICVLLELDAELYVAAIRSELYADCAGEPSIPQPARTPCAIARRFGIFRNSQLP